MARIRVLEEAIATQIAAGEVVERPASVVKELVENALDAGANIIHVEIAGGGLDRITVIDNGCGMDPEDAGLCLQRHATSKITAFSDLETVRTLGFRGEALPSIAAVSRLTLLTRPAECLEGTVVEAEGGKIVRLGVGGGPPGTTVTVSDLFYNTPARKKFTRTASQETAVISEMVGRLALARPEVAFRLTGNGRRLLATPGSGNLLDALAAVFGAGLAREMVPVSLETGGMAVSGYVGRPGVARGTRRYQVFLVNGRYIRSAYLAAAVQEALQGLLPSGRHPVLALSLTVDPALVDVNVHPAKHEVRFSRPPEVYALVHQAVRQAMGRPMHRTPEASVPTTWTGLGGPGRLFSGPRRDLSAPGADVPWQLLLTPEAGPAPEPGSEPALLEKAAEYTPWRELQLIGPLPPSYYLAQGSDGLYVIDLHAAHERVLFERFLAGLGASRGRQLVVPVSLEIRGREAEALDRCGAFLQRMGFVVEPFGEESFVIREMPALLEAGREDKLLLDLLERLAEEKPVDDQAAARLVAATLACHRALRSGATPVPEEVSGLLADLVRAEEPDICPHGRPTLVRISLRELARRFRRE